MVVLKQPFHFWWSEQWRKVSQILAVYFSTGVWCFFLRALKSLGKPCLKLENGESKSLRDLCGRFFLAGTGKNQAHHDSWDLLKLKPKKSASRVGNAWREHATWARILKKGNVYGMAICWLWVRPVVLRILDFKKQQVGSSYSFQASSFTDFIVCAGLRRSIPDLDTNGHGHQGYWMMFWTRRSAWLRHFWPTSSDQSINRFGDGSQGRSCGTIGSFPPKHSESEWYVPAILHQHLLP